MLPDAAYFASDDLDDTRDPFALDPDISAMCAECDPLAEMAACWAYMTKTTGMSRDAYYAQLSHMLLMAGVREISGYQGGRASQARRSPPCLLARGGRATAPGAPAKPHATLDTTLEQLVDDAATWLACARVCAQALGVSLPAGLEALKVQERLYTGYMPDPQRHNVRHRLYRDGVRTPSRRPNLTDRAVAEAHAWGLVR